MKQMKRVISLVLSFALLAGYIPTPTHAEDLSQLGLCEHHPEHIDCSYVAAVEAVECGHQHEDTCYAMTCVHIHGDCGYIAAVEGVACDHQHDEVCGYAAAVAEVPCSCVPEVKTELTHAAECAYDPSVAESTCTCTPTETVLETIHAEDCTYVPAVPESKCNHVHGECSYVEAMDAVPCDHDCTMDVACSEKILTCLHEHNEECGYAEGRVAVACDFMCEECANAEMDVASAEEHRYGTVYAPYIHTNDAAKPYSLSNGIYYSTNHSSDSEASYTIEANFDTTISFNYGVSSETNFDEFTLTHNGTQLFCISGLKSGTMTVDLAQGDVLVFTYEKDDSESDGDDRGWFEITSGDTYLNEELTTPNCRGDVCCLDCGQVLYEQLPHSITSIPAVESTCTTEGKTAGQVCSACGFVTVGQDTVPMAAHSFVNGICTICETTTYSEGITFKLNDDGTFYIVSGVGTFTGESLIIPQIYNRLPVKEIGALAFANCSKLTSVAIPPSITTIKDSAFYNCTGLKAVYISDLDAWCDISFDYEREWDEGLWIQSYSNPLKYAHNLYLNGEKVTDIVLSDAPNAHAFYGCNLNSVTFTRQVGLNTGVFRSSSLKELSIPGGPSYLSPYSLHECSNITGAFYLPASVTEVGDWTFWGPDIKIMYLEGSKIPNRCDDLDYGNTGPFYDSGAKVVYNCQLVQVDGNDYVIKDGEAWFIRCPQTRVGSVEILPQVTYGDQTYNVTKIGDYAFYKCDQITSITIPNSITDIGQDPFEGCSSLRQVNITDIANWCNITFKYASSNPLYYNCELYLNGELISDVQIPDSVMSINDYAFYGCDSLTSITMGSGVTSIGYHAFSYCSALSSVILGSGLNSIGVYAFSNCAGLTNIVIPNTVTIIDSRAFEDCTGLSSITISGSVTNVGYGVFGGCISLKNIRFESDAPTFNQSSFDGLTATVEYPANNLTWTADVMKNYGGTITWVPYTPEHTHEYGDDHKCECGVIGGTCGDNLIWMLDDEGTLTISGNGAMADYMEPTDAPWYTYQDKIKTLVVGNDVTTIGSGAFYGYNAYTYGSYKNLVQINLGNKVESIGVSAFYGCAGITDLVLPDSVTEIGKFAFSCCYNMEAVTWSKNLKVISEGAFKESGLAEVTLPEGLTTIEKEAFWTCTNLTKVVIPDSVTTLGVYVFDQCESLESVILPANLKTIPEQTFSYCAALATVDIPSNVTTIGKRAFYGYNKLTSVTIPECVSQIEDDAFGCSGLKEITFTGNAPTFGSYVFDYVTATAYYPANNKTWTADVMKNYGGTITWVTYTPEHTHEYGDDHKCECGAIGGTCGDNLIWVLSDGMLNISGTGNMEEYSGSSTLFGEPWASYRSQIQTVFIDAGVTSVDRSLFYYNKNLTAIYVDENNPNYSDNDGILFSKDETVLIWMPPVITGTYQIADSVKTIGAYAFSECDDLTSVVIPDSVTSIECRAFAALKNLTNVTIGNGVTQIGDSAFYLCTSLTDLILGNSVEIIGFSAFYNCGMTSLVIPDSTTYIGQFAFQGCPFMTLTLGNGVQHIGYWAFSQCPNLASVVLPASVRSIDDGAFWRCSALSEVRFQGEAPDLADEAFSGVNATAYYPANNDTWTEEMRQNYGGTLTWVLYSDIENRLILDSEDLGGYDSVWIDGAEKVIQKDGDFWYIDLPDSNARVMTTYAFHVDATAEDGVDAHRRYPVSMQVWTLENQNGVYSATKQEDFNDILQYSGMAIRVAGKTGIRMITSIDAEKKESLTNDGLAGYTLLEYGSAITWASQIGSAKPLVLGKSYVSSNYAYKKDVADPVFRYTGGMMQYTNVLVDFSNEQCADDIAMRPYMILADADGNEITIYGGIVERSIGYIALRNKGQFPSDTDPYDYIWDIIHAVYGNTYDAYWNPTWSDTIM